MFVLLAVSAALAAPVPQPAVKVVPIPKPDPDAAEFDKPPKGALVRLGSRQMRHGGGTVGDFAADGRTLFTAGYGMIREWDTDTNTLRRSIPITDTTNVMRLKSTPDGSKLLFDDYKHLHVFDRATKKRLHTLQLLDQSIYCHAVSPDGKTVAVGTFEGHVRLFDLSSGKLLDFDVTHPAVEVPTSRFGIRREKSPPNIYALAWSPDGKTLASSAQGDSVRGWNPLTGEERWALDDNRGYGLLAFTPDGKHLLVPVRAESVYRNALWDAGSGKKAADLDGFGSAYGLAVSADGRYFCNGRDIWDTKAEKVVQSLPTGAWPQGVAFSRDGKRVALDWSGVQLFDTATGKELFDDTGHAGMVLGISVTQDGKLAATAGADGTARVWDAGTGKLLHTLRGHQNGVASVSLSPDGKRLATGDLDTVRVFDLKTGKEVWKADGHSQLVQVAWSPDGDTVAVGGGNLTVHLYDAKSGDPLRKLVGYNGGMNTTWHFAWTPDSTGIVSPVNLMPVFAHNDDKQPVPRMPVGGPGGEGDGKYRFVLWEVKSGDRVRQIGPASDRCHAAVAVDVEGLHAAIGGDRVTLAELKTGREKWQTEAGRWTPLAFTGEDTLYAGRVCLDAKTGKTVSELKGPLGQVMGLAVPVKGKTVLTASQFDNTAVVWRR